MGNNQLNDDYTKYYKIIDVIGRGQFGKVFKGKTKKTKELRAIKVIEINNRDKDFLKYRWGNKKYENMLKSK